MALLELPLGSSTHAYRFLEAVYALEAFNRTQLCDIRRFSKFLIYVRIVIYKFHGHHTETNKITLIHNLPYPGWSRSS